MMKHIFILSIVLLLSTQQMLFAMETQQQRDTKPYQTMIEHAQQETFSTEIETYFTKGLNVEYSALLEQFMMYQIEISRNVRTYAQKEKLTQPQQRKVSGKLCSYLTLCYNKRREPLLQQELEKLRKEIPELQRTLHYPDEPNPETEQ